MKLLLKWTGIVILLLIVVMTAATFALRNRTFEAPYPDIHASKDPAVIEHGKQIIYGPAHCAHCHTPAADLEKVEKGEIVPLIGGHVFAFEPGTLVTPNITPDNETGIGLWKDEVIARSLRYGVSHQGHAIFDFMPFHNLSDEDLTAVISYLRSAEPVKHKVPETEYNFLGDVLRAFMIKPVGPDMAIAKRVQPEPTPAYGKYLAESVANCRGCHTERDLQTGAYTGPYYGGGLHVESDFDPSKTLVTPNITTDKTSGRLAYWTEEDFIKRFRTGKLIRESIMPWGPFSRMSDDELKAIYRYLKTIEPVKNDPGPVLISSTE